MKRRTFLLCSGLAFVVAGAAVAQDWPQWRGPNRDGRTIGFDVPAAWPKELTQKWRVEVGEGVSTPALVGTRLYVFSRQDGQEVTRCLDAATGKELWQDAYQAAGASGPASRFSGPRSSPTVAQGKVITLGVQGTLSCLDAASGKLLWRNDDFRGSVPRFNPSSSAVVVDGLCIAQLGGESNGVIVAYELASGSEKWRWTGDCPAYGSPMPITIGDLKAVLAPTDKNMVVVGVSDGKLLWQIPYTQGRYNAATPIVDGQTIIYAGPERGMTAAKLERQGDKLTSEELWTNADNSVQFNTPVLKDGFVFGLSTLNSLFCLNAENGQTAWNAPLVANATGEARQESGGRVAEGDEEEGEAEEEGTAPLLTPAEVLLALTPAAELVVLEPSGTEFRKLASYKVAAAGTYAHPVAVGNKLYVQDQEAVTLWAIE